MHYHFRNLVTSDKLSKMFFETLSPTNMYVFIKKVPINNRQVLCNNSFVLVNGYRIPKSCKIIVLKLSTNLENITCCNDFKVFSDKPSYDFSKLSLDNSNEDDHNDFQEIETTDKVKWFQSTYVMKGFKDCVVNGISIINTWLH